MIALGLLFAVLCAASKAIDTLINKDVMKQQSAVNHAFYRIIFVTPILFIASLFHWHFSVEVIGFLVLYGILEAINIFCHQTAVKKSNALHIEIISKSKVIFTLIVSFVLVIDTLSFWNTIGIVVFMIGTVLTINVQNRQDGEKTGCLGIVLELISVLARTFKPFILKYCIQNSYVSNETMSFLSMIVAFGALYVIFRPKLDFKEISVKKYFGQAVVVGLGMLLSGWAIMYANTVIVNAIESTSIIFVMLISFILMRKKYPILSVIGCIISVIGIIMAIVM
jgi:drug/metabolite transporter (DMT)-like permease